MNGICLITDYHAVLNSYLFVSKKIRDKLRNPSQILNFAPQKFADEIKMVEDIVYSVPVLHFHCRLSDSCSYGRKSPSKHPKLFLPRSYVVWADGFIVAFPGLFYRVSAYPKSQV
jgi:hypothetical protein